MSNFFIDFKDGKWIVSAVTIFETVILLLPIYRQINCNEITCVHLSWDQKRDHFDHYLLCATVRYIHTYYVLKYVIRPRLNCNQLNNSNWNSCWLYVVRRIAAYFLLIYCSVTKLIVYFVLHILFLNCGFQLHYSIDCANSYSRIKLQ